MPPELQRAESPSPAVWTRIENLVDAALHGPRPAKDDGLILLSHKGTKTYTMEMLEQARAAEPIFRQAVDFGQAEVEDYGGITARIGGVERGPVDVGCRHRPGGRRRPDDGRLGGHRGLLD